MSLLFVAAASAQASPQPLPLRPPAPIHPEVVLAPDDGDGLVAACGLGDGGIGPGVRQALRWSDEGCVTAGGVQVHAQSFGVKLTFPSGRELLVAPDGYVHLRSQEKAGPFAGGCELCLADGSRVRIFLSPSHPQRLRDVVVVHKDRALQPWRRGAPADEQPRPGGWAGIHLFACGDGGDLFRAIALGPLVVLDRQLTVEARADQVPTERLVLITGPLLQALLRMPRQHEVTDAPMRQAVAAITAIGDHSSTIFPAGASLRRAEHDRLRWLLGAGFELQFDRDGPLSPRLQLYAGDRPLPMVEWTLRADSAVFLTNPRPEVVGTRWHGNGTRLGGVAAHLQAREALFELPYALRVIERLQGGKRGEQPRRR